MQMCMAETDSAKCLQQNESSLGEEIAENLEGAAQMVDYEVSEELHEANAHLEDGEVSANLNGGANHMEECEELPENNNEQRNYSCAIRRRCETQTENGNGSGEFEGSRLFTERDC